MFSKQQNSAADLSMLVLESLEKSGAKVDDETLGEFIEHYIIKAVVLMIVINLANSNRCGYIQLSVVRAEYWISFIDY